MESNEEQRIALLQYVNFFYESSDEDDNEFLIDVLSSFSDEDEEEETKNFVIVAALLNERRGKRQMRPRIKNYVERIVPTYTAEEFKTHFR